MAAVMRLSVTSLGRTWLSTMFLRCKAVSDIARLRNRAAVPNCPVRAFPKTHPIREPRRRGDGNAVAYRRRKHRNGL